MGKRQQTDGGLPHRSRLYSDLSAVYDHLFTPIFSRRIASVISGLNLQSGVRVLEVGVGTGLSLDAYPSHCQVTAIDLSEEMLSRARRKIDPTRHGHINLLTMDAMKLEFPDDYFDVVTAFHVVTVVPEPEQLIRGMSRVCKPDGRVVIINHFSSERPVVRGVVDFVDPLTRKLGWSTRLDLNKVMGGKGLQLKSRYKTSPWSLFTVVEARKPVVGSVSAS